MEVKRKIDYEKQNHFYQMGFSAGFIEGRQEGLKMITEFRKKQLNPDPIKLCSKCFANFPTGENNGD